SSDDALEDGDFGLDGTGHDDVGTEAHQGPGGVRFPGGVHRTSPEPPDELAGQVLEPALLDAAAVPGVEPGVEVVQPVEGGDELVMVVLSPDPGEHRVDQVV